MHILPHLVILFGYNGDHPPADHEGLLEFARSLAAPDLYNKMKTATPRHMPVMRCEWRRTSIVPHTMAFFFYVHV